MIDITNEDLIPLSEVPALPCVPRRRGRPVSRSTVYRWAKGGIRGVVLESVPVGGTGLATSLDALARFFQRLASPRTALRSSPAEQRRSQDRARAVLAAAGI